MPRITRVYTRTGDDGTTALGSGARTRKDSRRIVACGEVDELNSVLGQALAEGVDPRLAGPLQRVQNELFHLGSDLSVPATAATCTSVPRIEERHVVALEAWLDELLAELAPLANFVLPGGTPAAARLHVARAVCRRAERAVVALNRREPIGPWPVRYLNRLSDALFVAARAENAWRGRGDVLWNSRA